MRDFWRANYENNSRNNCSIYFVLIKRGDIRVICDFVEDSLFLTIACRCISDYVVGKVLHIETRPSVIYCLMEVYETRITGSNLSNLHCLDNFSKVILAFGLIFKSFRDFEINIKIEILKF